MRFSSNYWCIRPEHVYVVLFNTSSVQFSSSFRQYLHKVLQIGGVGQNLQGNFFFAPLHSAKVFPLHFALLPSSLASARWKESLKTDLSQRKVYFLGVLHNVVLDYMA